MYVILRHEKHSTMGTIGAAASHTMRTRSTPNAAPGPAPEVWIGSRDPAADVAAMLPEKRRKNAVLAIECLVTASPGFFKQQPEKQWRKYLRDQVEMLQSYYGPANVVSAVLHLDETTPHLAVMIVPLIDGKLNARAFVGGREACRTLQDLAGGVGKTYGLSRGKPGSQADHTAVRQWYSDLAPRADAARESIAKAEEVERAAAEISAQRAKLRSAAEQVRQQHLANLAERRRLEQLAEAMTPEQQYQAARRLDAIKQAERPAADADHQVAKPGVTLPKPGRKTL